MEKRMIEFIKENTKCGIRTLTTSMNEFTVPLAILCFKSITTILELYEKEKVEEG